MVKVLQLAKQLEKKPVVPKTQGLTLRPFTGPDDIELWLKTRLLTFADEFSPPKPWSKQDWEREFSRKPWWQPERMWFAQIHPPLARESEDGATVGTVCLGLRGKGINARPSIHWLMVVPEWRWHGVGRTLVTQAELFAWDEGQRELVLDTLSEWAAAAAFYQKLNYKALEKDEERPEV